MLINIIIKSINKSIVVCHFDTDTGIGIMIIIRCHTFDMVYSPTLQLKHNLRFPAPKV